MFSHHSESTLKTFGLFQTHYPPLINNYMWLHWRASASRRGCPGAFPPGERERALFLGGGEERALVRLIRELSVSRPTVISH